MALRLNICLAAIAFVTHPSLATAACYDRSGTEQIQNLNRSPLVPCQSDTEETHCCAPGETCLSNGLCFVFFDSSLNNGYCANSGWRAPCSQYCSQYAFSTLFRCNNNNWCCSEGANVTSCCQDIATPSKMADQALVLNGTAFAPGVELLAIGAGTVDGYGTGIGNASCAEGAQATTTVVMQPTASCKASSQGSSNTMAVGIGAGLGVGLPFLTIILVLAMSLHKERRRSPRLEIVQRTPISIHGNIPAVSRYGQKGWHRELVSELGSEGRAELSGREVGVRDSKHR